MKSYSICLSPSDMFHLAYGLLGLSMLSQMARFHSFIWLSNILLCVCMFIYVCLCVYIYIYSTSFFICSFTHGHLDCFLILDIVNNVAVNIRVQVSFLKSGVFEGFVF